MRLSAMLRPRRPGSPGWAPTLAVAALLWLLAPAAHAASDPGRLFFTPAQRAQLEAARARKALAGHAAPQADADAVPPPVRYDGVVIRSDGRVTRWVDGRPRVDDVPVSGLKPGQVRAEGKVYEPYQVLRPGPAPDSAKEPMP